MKTLYRVLILIVAALTVAIIVWTRGWRYLYQIVGLTAALLGCLWAIDAWVLDYPVIKPFLWRRFGKTKYIALILAAGMSQRWCESIKPHNWKREKKLMEDKGFSGPYRDPNSSQGKHKALAKVQEGPLIRWSLIKLSKAHIEDIIVTINSKFPAQIEIIDWIGQWNSSSSLRVTPVIVHGKSEVAASVYAGLESIKGDKYADVIVAYSDIVWKPGLLEELKNAKGGDIVFLVDKDWRRNNYPEYRTYHDELHAELVFGEGEKIKTIGEVVNKFEGYPKWSSETSRYDMFKDIFENNCQGEVIGLFKFSPKGRRVFCEEYRKVEGSYIDVAEWGPPNFPQLPLPFTPKSGQLPTKDALLGGFLEYLNRETELRILPIVVKTEKGWAEIDHWGDVCRTEKQIQEGNDLLSF